MAMRDALLPEFDHLMEGTRRTLERVPEAKFGWKPHDKSYSLQALASHLANIPSWMDLTLNSDKLDVAPEGDDQFTTPQAESTRHLVEMFDANAKAAREVLAKTDDATFMKSWTLLAGGEEIFTMPRAAVLRGFIMNHMIHHRAQLGVYLRLNDVAVPALFGPSADEESF